MRMPPKKKSAPPPTFMSTTRLEMGLEILSELDTPSILALLEDRSPEGDESGENAAIVGLLGSALKSRLLRRLSAVALATEDELEAAEERKENMDTLVKLRGRASWMENFQAVKGFFTLLGISDLGTLASFVSQAGVTREVPAGIPLEPSPSGG